MATGDFLARIKLALEGKEAVIQGLSETQRATQKLTQTKVTTIFDKEGVATGKQIAETFKQVDTSSSGAVTKMGDFEKSLRRVIVVAPVWMAFRAVLQSVMSTISEGFKTWEEFDKQLIKSKAVVHGFAGTTDQAMVELETTIRSFSKESGIALADVASAFYRFGTVGIQFSDALSGAIASAKLAKATLGDVDTISRSLAMTYRLLGDTIDSTLSPMGKQENLAGKILHLWKTNAFEANEFSQSLNAFISTANIANFTADQTVATLAALGTAGVQGSRGGTLLKTSIQKLVENLDKLAPKLGLAVNPEMENTFELFMRVLGAVNELSKTKGIPAEALKSIQEIFGGTRGAQVISALNALLPELRKNLEDLGKDPQQYIKQLNDRFREVNDTVSGQLQIYRNLRAQLGESFVKGLVGANDFKDSLYAITGALEAMLPIASEIGHMFFLIAHPISGIKGDFKKIEQEVAEFSKRIDDAVAGNLSLVDTIETVTLVEQKLGKEGEWIVNNIKATAAALAQSGAATEKIDKLVTDWAEKNISIKEEERQKVKELSIELQTKLALSQKELNILELQKSGASELVIAHRKLGDIINVMVDRYNDLKDASGATVAQISQQQVLAAVLSGDFEKVLEIFKQMTLTEQELNSLAESYNLINKSILSDLDDRIGRMSTILRMANEQESVIIRQEMALKAMIYGEDYIKNSMDDRLRLAQALTKEANEQEKSSSRLIELFKIAKKYGQDIAQEVSKFLGGTIAFKDLSAGALKALRRVAPTEFERGTAEEFFRETNFRFPEAIERERIRNRNIDILENINRNAFRFPEDMEQERERRRNIQILENINIEPIQINVDLESRELLTKIKTELIRELDDNQSVLSKKINEAIENF